MLFEELSPADRHDVQLLLWSDADWCGDPADTNSTSGLQLELYSSTTGRRWPIGWNVRRQGSTSSSTAEAETVAFAFAVKHEGLPTLILLDSLLDGARRPMELVAKVDTTQAINAVTKGYSKNVKVPERTHRCSINSVHELIKSNKLVVEHCPTLAHSGDGFTTCLNPAKFIAARDMM